jgi:hypothetical protein
VCVLFHDGFTPPHNNILYDAGRASASELLLSPFLKDRKKSASTPGSRSKAKAGNEGGGSGKREINDTGTETRGGRSSRQGKGKSKGLRRLASDRNVPLDNDNGSVPLPSKSACF